MSKHIHIISFDIPYPANYGGVIDVFYKIKALHKAGFQISLHCYQYGRTESEELSKYCKEVFYYPRSAGRRHLFVRKPYIVASRHSDQLIERLLKDRSPILFEGLHCSSFLDTKALENRFKVLRAHNIEHDYYESLAAVENNIFKRYYFYNEASKLKKQEKVLKKADNVLAISPKDHQYFLKKYKNSIFVPAFHAYEEVRIKPGKGDFILYHGNLAVGENNEAAMFLATKVFPKLKHKCVIAGTKPSQELRLAAEQSKNIELRSQVSTQEIHELIENAQINILPTFQSTGIKLKLLAALYVGRHCLVNQPMVEKTGLESLCHKAEDAASFIKLSNKLMQQEFSDAEVALRKELLSSSYSNEESVKSLIQLFA